MVFLSHISKQHASPVWKEEFVHSQRPCFLVPNRTQIQTRDLRVAPKGVKLRASRKIQVAWTWACSLLAILTFALKPEKEEMSGVLTSVPHRGKLRQKDTSTPQHHFQSKTQPFNSNNKN